MAIQSQSPETICRVPISEGVSRIRTAALITEALSSRGDAPLPSADAIATATTFIPASLPDHGLGDATTLSHLINTVVPGLSSQSLSPHYYGFVTGSILPIAEATDNIVTALDQNVMVHVPEASVSTTIEAKVGRYLAELLDLRVSLDQPAKLEWAEERLWTGSSITTGATASNIVGLAMGREAIINNRLKHHGYSAITDTVSNLGLLEACRRAGVRKIQVLVSAAHSCIYKAASILGLGRESVIDVGDQTQPWALDWDKLKRALADGVAGSDTVSIVVIGAGEVNTGKYAISGDHMQQLRKLADAVGAWIHVDGAFGIFARTLPATKEFMYLREKVQCLDLADSIGADAHKCLNVPYDAAFILTPHAAILESVLSNGSAAYLATAASAIPSPLNISLSNSSRFRALPIYAVLLSLGRSGLQELFVKQIRLARAVASWIYDQKGYILLPTPVLEIDKDRLIRQTGIIVLFSAKDDVVNETLVQRINSQNRIYVSGTVWAGRKAVRIAVAGWRIDVERDVKVIAEVLETALLC